VNTGSPTFLAYFFTAAPPGGRPDGHFPNLLADMRSKLAAPVMTQIDQLIAASRTATASAAGAAGGAAAGATGGTGTGGGGH
jgi:hypothetical protein